MGGAGCVSPTRYQSFHASTTHQSSLRKWSSGRKAGDEGRNEMAIELGTPGIAGRVGSRAHQSASPEIVSWHHLRFIDPARWVYTLEYRLELAASLIFCLTKGERNSILV